MGFFDFLNKRMSEPITPVTVTIGEDTQLLYANELAFAMCVNLITNSVTKCELVTYKRGKREKQTNGIDGMCRQIRIRMRVNSLAN